MSRVRGRDVLRIAATAFASLALAAWGDAPPTADARLDEAVRLQESGDTAGALAVAEEILAAEPSNARAWNVRGWIRLEVARLDEADGDFAKALEISPQFPDAAGNRGIVRKKRNDPLGAEEWYGKALRMAPDDSRWLVHRASLRRDQGRNDLARKDLERAVRVAPGNRYAWSHLGWLEQSESKWFEALSNYRKALEIDPADAWTLSARARCLAEYGHLDAALDDVEASARANPSADPSLVTFDLFATGARGEQVARDLGILRGVPMRLRRAEVEAIRGLRFLEDVPLVAVTQDDAGTATTAGMDAEGTAETRRARTRGLARLGLVQTATDVVAARAEARRAQIAGYYSPSQKKFFVVAAEGAEPHDPSVVPHELVHALQDQHFSLEGFWEKSVARKQGDAADEDLELATRMVVEGEATLVQSLWTHRRNGFGAADSAEHVSTFASMVRSLDPLAVARMLVSMASASGTMPPDERRRIDALEPYALVHEWAPYLQGMAFVERVHSKGGWDAVTRLWTDPPRTTEQCLHPEKWLDARDEPTPLPSPALPVPDAWRAADSRVLGEMNVQLLLRVRGADTPGARRAAHRWDGDLLRTWTAPDGRAGVVWATTWDDARDAIEFFAAYRKVLPAKYPRLGPTTERTPPRIEGAPEDALPAWTSLSFDCGDAPDSRGRLVLRGREVFVVEGFPEDVTEGVAQALLTADVAHVD